MEYQKLSEFIDNLTGESKMHISLLDVSGMLSSDILSLPPGRWFHTCSFCSAAKSTERGLKLCLACKRRANRKAMSDDKYFYGECPYGITEVVWPVRKDGETKCIVFVGNIVVNMDRTVGKIKKSCSKTENDPEKLIACLPETQASDSVEPYVKTAHSVASYISLLSDRFPADNKEGHWAVRAVKEYVNCHYDERLTLESMAKLYFVNEKYLGRIFTKNTGESFRQYLNEVRLEHSCELLKTTNKSILEVSLLCGFGNVTYMNRVFKSKYGCTPGEYRKKKK